MSGHHLVLIVSFVAVNKCFKLRDCYSSNNSNTNFNYPGVIKFALVHKITLIQFGLVIEGDVKKAVKFKLNNEEAAWKKQNITLTDEF